VIFVVLVLSLINVNEELGGPHEMGLLTDGMGFGPH